MADIIARDEQSFAEKESRRLAALDRYDILDTPREDSFDNITRLARKVFRVPITIVSVIDGHRQWYKACEGLDAQEAPRGNTFCTHTIEGCRPLIVPDATRDPRFADNPHVVNDPRIRFYAGAPITTKDGHNIGTICAIDTEPREFGAEQAELLQINRDSALEVAEKLRAAIARLTFDILPPSVRVTASFGVASLDRATTDLDSLLANADAALYEAKAAGRNQVTAWKGAQDEARRSRRRVLKGGQILFHDRASTMDCTVRSQSEDGAGLDVSSTVGIPKVFRLAIKADGFERACRAVARTDKHIEVEFI